MTIKPTTLGDKLAADSDPDTGANPGKWLRGAARLGLHAFLMAAIAAWPVWWAINRPDIDNSVIPVFLTAFIAMWYFAFLKRPGIKPHFLLANDLFGVMRDLRLDAKTVIFDGSNIYHFGRDNGVDAQVLGELVNQLRIQGYRVICFFRREYLFHAQRKRGIPTWATTFTETARRHFWIACR